MTIKVKRIADPRQKKIARKGGGKGGGAPSPTTPHTPTEFPNTIRSMATARILEVLSEGMVSGMHTAHYDGANFWQSVLLDETPVADLRQQLPIQDHRKATSATARPAKTRSQATRSRSPRSRSA